MSDGDLQRTFVRLYAMERAVMALMVTDLRARLAQADDRAAAAKALRRELVDTLERMRVMGPNAEAPLQAQIQETAVAILGAAMSAAEG